MKAIMHMMKQMMGAYEEDDVKNTTRLKTSQKDNRSSARILEGDDSAEDQNDVEGDDSAEDQDEVEVDDTAEDQNDVEGDDSAED